MRVIFSAIQRRAGSAEQQRNSPASVMSHSLTTQTLSRTFSLCIILSLLTQTLSRTFSLRGLHLPLIYNELRPFHSCCEPCAAATCDGHCEASSDMCTEVEYDSGSCDFGGCSCCSACVENSDCADAAGLCYNVDADCPDDLQPNLFAGCNSDSCKCCAKVSQGLFASAGESCTL